MSPKAARTNSSAFISFSEGPRLVLPGGSEIHFTRLQSWLVSFVYTSGPKGVSSDEVARMLWGGESRQQLNRNISQLLYTLNSSFDDLILVQRVGDRLCPTVEVEGSLVELPDNAPTAEAEFFLERRLEAKKCELVGELWSEYETYLRTGATSEAVATLDRIAIAEPNRVEAILDAAWLESRMGRVRSAAQRLLNFLDASPPGADRSRVAVALEKLKRGHPLQPRSSHSRRALIPPLVGRSDVISEVRSFLRDLDVRHVLIQGDSGSGKTRVLEEVVFELGFRHMGPDPVLIRSEPGDRQKAFRVAERILTALEVPFPEQSRAGDDNSRQLMESLLKAVHNDAEGYRRVIAIDDLHHADPSSLMILAELTSSREFRAGTFVSTAAFGAASNFAPVADYLDSSSRGLRSVDLPELAESSAIKLLEELEPEFTHDQRVYLVSLLGGYPGILTDRALLREIAAAGPVGRSSPLRKVLEARLSDLSPDQLLAARALTLLRGKPNLDLLGRLLEMPPIPLLRIVEELVRLNVLERDEGEIRFRTRLVRTLIESSMSAEERRILHRAIVVRLGTTGLLSNLDLAIHTASAEMSTEAVYRSLVDEAGDLEMKGALPEALDRLLVAQDLPEGASDLPMRERIGRLLESVRRHGTAVRVYGEAAQIARDAGDAARFRVNSVKALMNQARLHPSGVDVNEVRSLLEECLQCGDWDVAAEAAELALWILDFAGDSPASHRILIDADRIEPRANSANARAWVNLARTRHVYLGDLSVALRAAKAAVQYAKEANDRWLIGKALNRLMVCLYYTGRLGTSEGSATVQECLSHAEMHNNELFRQDILYNRCNWLLDIGEIEAASSALDSFRSDLPPLASPLDRMRLNVLEGEIRLRQHRPADSLECFRLATDCTPGLSGSYRVHVAAGMVLSLLELGRIKEALEIEPILQSVDPKDRLSHSPCLIAISRATLCVRKGEADAAVSGLEEFAESLRHWMIPGFLGVRLEQFRQQARHRMQIPAGQLREAIALADELSLQTRGHQLRTLARGRG